MPGKQNFWNPVLETLAPEKIKQLQLSKFKKIFRWTYENSIFHRRLYDNAGIKPQDVQSFEDIQRVPKVEKSMMRDIQRKEPFPYGEALCVPLDEVTIFRQTSGTTGQPVYQPDTWQDWEWWMECWSYILWAQGYRPQEDRLRGNTGWGAGYQGANFKDPGTAGNGHDGHPHLYTGDGRNRPPENGYGPRPIADQ
jgi:phenylacetate-coenzyme A ligase PaaK-like adenylate-forming protein